MSKYTVQFKHGISGAKVVNIEADSAEQALKIGGKDLGLVIDRTDPFFDQSHLIEAVLQTPAFGKTFGYAPFEYSTGRIYDKPQVLLIKVEQQTTDEFGLIDLVATFVDSSRHISGRVKTVLFKNDLIGEAVLQAYDAGQYSPL